MKVEIEIPDPPDGWVYDGFRIVNGEVKWFDGIRWIDCYGNTTFAYPTAIKAKPLWTPSPELVAVVSSGWIAMDSCGSWFWYRDKPTRGQHTWEGVSMNSMEWIRRSVLPSHAIPWEKCCFRIGGDE
jgi:hypothetical protein